MSETLKRAAAVLLAEANAANDQHNRPASAGPG